MLDQFIILLPEIMLAVLAMCMQVVAVFYKNHARIIAKITIFIALLIVFWLYFSAYEVDFFGSLLFVNAKSLPKAITLLLAIMSLIIYHDLTKIAQENLRIEFITLSLFSTLGICISISANDFITLFCGLELQSLPSYALAAFNTKDSKSSEAGLKYFILGALMSGLMLLGISFLYGFSGSIKFLDVKNALNGEFNIGIVVGSILMISSILFKLSAAPLHIWTPDVYEGSPISSVSFFAVAQKFGMVMILMNILNEVIGGYLPISSDILKIVAIFSMLVGSIGAILQNSLKRLMGYSTILNIGYCLVALSLHSIKGNYVAFIFILIYTIGVAGFFACLVALFGKKSDDATFDDLKGIATTRKTLAAIISIIMFSMIGLPPLAGFWGKYYVFYNAILHGEFVLAVIGILTSVVAAFYYLKIIKYIYFVESKNEINPIPTHRGLSLVTFISISFTLLFCIFASSYII